MVIIEYVTRQGRKVRCSYTEQQAADRLFFLEQDERNTRICSPSDSGDVRFSYLAETKALRAAGVLSVSEAQ